MKQGSRVSRIRRIFSFRILWRTALIGAILVLAFYAEENWRGHRAWTNYVQEKTAQGLHLDWKSCIPSQVPDDENFAMTPVLAALYDFKPGTQEYQYTNFSGRIDQLTDSIFNKRLEFANGNWILGLHTSLSEVLTNQFPGSNGRFPGMTAAMLKRYGLVPPSNSVTADREIESTKVDPLVERYSQMSKNEQAQEILQSMETMQPVWDELRSAMKRPYCLYPAQYDRLPIYDISLPHLHEFPGIILLLRLSAICHLELGQAESALADLELGFHLSNSLKTDPWKASYLLRCQSDRLLTQAIWEGTSRHLWSAAQLERLQKVRTPGNEIAEVRRVLKCDRAKSIQSVDAERKQYRQFQVFWEEMRNDGNPLPALPYFLYLQGPQGWFELEKIKVCQRYDEFVPRVFDPVTERVSTNEIARISRLWDGPARQHSFLYHSFFAGLLALRLDSIAPTVAREQTTVDLAYLGCALERYFLDRKEYPAGLDDLMPQYVEKVPHDVLTGETYRYRLIDKEHFVVYSIGINGKDDGGIANNKPSNRVSMNEGDWIWQGGIPADLQKPGLPR